MNFTTLHDGDSCLGQLESCVSVAAAMAMSVLLGCGEAGSTPISLEPGLYEMVATCNGRTFEEQVSVRLQDITTDTRLDGEACNGGGGDAGDPDPRLVFLCIDEEIGLADFTVRCLEVEEAIVCTGRCREADGGNDLVEADGGGVVVLQRTALP